MPHLHASRTHARTREGASSADLEQEEYRRDPPWAPALGSHREQQKTSSLDIQLYMTKSIKYHTFVYFQ